MHRSVIALLVLIVFTITASAQGLPVPSYWLNQRGSEMKLYKIEPDGRIRGYYINHAVGFECQGLPGHESEARVRRDHVRIVVLWTNRVHDCHSATVWYGRVAGHTIWTKWALYIYNLDGTVRSIVHGNDVFQQQP